MDRDPAGRDPCRDRGASAGSPGAPLPGGPSPAPDARGAGRHPAAEPVRGLARPARTEDQDLLPAGERDAAAPADLPPTGGAPPCVRAPPRGGRGGPRRRGHAPGDLLRVQPGRMRQERAVAARVRTPAHDARRGRPHPRARGDPPRVDGRGGSRNAGLLRLPRRVDGGDRRPPRGHAPGLQGDGRGAVRGGTRQGRVRHRDPLARHQHAGQDRSDRRPVEVPGRAARDPHARGIHAAHRASRPAGDRRPGPRGGRVPATGAVRTRGRARRHAHVQPHVVVPPFVQHGREPRAQLHARAGPPVVELVVRAVPGRPRGGGARADPAAGPRRAGGVPHEHGVPRRRLPRVLGDAGQGPSDAR